MNNNIDTTKLKLILSLICDCTEHVLTGEFITGVIQEHVR
jgi:hypothetical protein